MYNRKRNNIISQRKVPQTDELIDPGGTAHPCSNRCADRSGKMQTDQQKREE